MTAEQLKEVWRVTERRDGCVYKTRRIGKFWLTAEEQREFELAGLKIVPISTERAEAGLQTIRGRRDS